MRLGALPSALTVGAVAAIGVAALAALVLGVDVARVGTSAGIALLSIGLLFALDVWRSRTAWRAADIELRRRLPASFAVGVDVPVQVQIRNTGRQTWVGRIFDHADPALATVGLPTHAAIPAEAQLDVTYWVRAERRGDVTFAPAELRIRSRWRFAELTERLGPTDLRRVYPNFAQLARYAWLTGNQRLNEIGIKTFHKRGAGTDFKQLVEYVPGDPVRHIDWKATLRMQKPIVRQFQDERDQRVLFLIDCGRRMRADDRDAATAGTSHFDQVLNAVMLLAYVALKRGDAVGAMTFGTPDGAAKLYAPTKGLHALDEMMSELYAVQPTPTHSDYALAAEDLMRRQPKRALVIVITNFRDEDGAELGDALKLLRSRHLVLLASLRERIVREIVEQPLKRREAAIEVASAHLYEQARDSAFRRLAARDALMVDVEPARLGVELVNRYNAIKKSGRL